MVWEKLLNKKEALASYNKAIALDPQNAFSRMRLQIFLLRRVFPINFYQEVSKAMEKKKKESEKEVSRRNFVKKLAYLAPAIAILVIPKYTAAQTPCTTVCPGGRCTNLR
jgi:hypothetical protein